MAIKNTKSISNWEELIRYVERINPYKNTLIISGWVNKMDDSTGSTEIDTLVFTLSPVDVLRDIYCGKYDKKKQ